MAALAMVPKPTTLWDIEEHLQALLESAELVTPDQEDEFVADLLAAFQADAAKIDATQGYLCWLAAQASAAGAEIARLSERAAAIERDVERTEKYVLRVIQAQGPDAKGKYRKLAGNTVTMSAAACPASVAVLDPAAVPDDYKKASLGLKMSPELLAAVKAALAEQFPGVAIGTPSIDVSRSAIKAAIAAGTKVAGADLETGKYRLVRK